MSQFISILILGISYGFVYFLLASGMTLTLGLLRVVNMSHGAIYMFSGYCGVVVFKATGSWLLALIAGGAVGGLLGLLLETGFLRRLYKTPANQVLLTIGIINILQNVTEWIWGGYGAGIPKPSFLQGFLTLGEGVTIQYYRFFIIIFGAVIAVALYLMQEKTKVGAMVRAGMDNSEISGTLGINSRSIFLFVFVLGSVIAGLSSMVGGMLDDITSMTGWNILLSSIIVVVVGGTGSIPGALLGGLTIGLVEQFGYAYLPGLAPYIKYIVLIVILVVRPQGFMGRKLDVNKASDDYSNMTAAKRRSFSPVMLGENPSAGVRSKLKIYNAIPYVLALIALVVIGLTANNTGARIWTQVLIYALFAMSLDVVMGYTGNRSFGHAAFFGMGGYAVGLLVDKLAITSFWVALPCVIVACAILSAIIGYFTLRLSGTNFLLVTMAFGQLLSVIASTWKEVTRGADGINISNPDFGFEMKWSNQGRYFFILIVFLICFFILYRIVHSSFGHTLQGIRGNEGRMRALGFNTWSLKYAGVIIAGIFAGIAGMLYAYSNRIVNPEMFNIETSALPMLMVILGGGATLWGPALGAMVIILVKNYAGQLWPQRWMLFLGILYVACVMFLRGGLAPILSRFWDWVGTKFFAKELAEARSQSEAEITEGGDRA